MTQTEKKVISTDAGRWMWLTQRIFASDRWESRLERVARMHPRALYLVEIAIKDWGMILSPEHAKGLKDIKKKLKKEKFYKPYG
jgi:hypothetical protein